MESLRILFRKPEFHFFLFFISLVLFGWPILSITEGGRNYSIFIYLFIAWVAIILLLFLIARSHNIKGPTSTEEKKKDEVTDV
jgi:predicted membrane channel-forming protein YqfA (hemolysin III family)